MIGQDLRRFRMEELKFERADGTWAAAPGLDIRALTTDAELRVRRPPSRSTASHNGGGTVYSNMTRSPAGDAWGGYSRQARHEWSAMEAVNLGRDQVTLLARQNRLCAA